MLLKLAQELKENYYLYRDIVNSHGNLLSRLT